MYFFLSFYKPACRFGVYVLVRLTVTLDGIVDSESNDSFIIYKSSSYIWIL